MLDVPTVVTYGHSQNKLLYFPTLFPNKLWINDKSGNKERPM